MEKKNLLNDNWEFSLHKTNEPFEPAFKIKKGKWFDASVPGTIHTDLLANKIIPDPFFADYEKYLQWIAFQEWSYRTYFDFPESFNEDPPVILKFDGLDTISEIFLNYKKIAESDNMFHPVEVDVTEFIKEKGNKLEVVFKSPILYAKEEEEKYGKLPVALNSERVYIRKAQYSFGWDWGPSFTTSGIWRNVYLVQPSTAEITNFIFNTVELNNNKADLNIVSEIKTSSFENVSIEVNLYDGQKIVFEERYNVKENNCKIDFSIFNPKLWFPNGYGEPHLYNLVLKLYEGNQLKDVKESLVGLRTFSLQLKQGDDNTFRFIINGKPIFARGVNWIPSDSFIPRTTYEKYERLLRYAAEGNMNIVRVWGGGFYENDEFYEICDKLGLLVWQDFMFACASYPIHKEFLKKISEEFDYNIKRLRNHPSLAIWCGNNENEWIWFQEQKKTYKEMPGYIIYNEILPKKIKQHDPLRPYWQSSPFGNDEDPNSESSGNRHQWQLWSMWSDYNNVFSDKSLFVTEFGWQGPANKSTLEKVIPVKSRTVQSEIFEFHNKQVEGNERLFRFMAAHLPVKTDWESYLYLAQLNQGLALSTCLYHWRSREPETNGSIIWQLNDCWPVSSWAVVDSDSIPKPSYYMVKNIFNQQIIVFRKNESKGKQSEISIFLKNSSDEQFNGNISVKTIKLPYGKIHTMKKINVKAKGRTEDMVVKLNLEPENCIILVTIRDNKKNIVHRNIYKEKEWKHLQLPKVKIKVKYNKKENTVKVYSNEPAFYVYLHKENTVFDKNMFILLPGEEEVITPDLLTAKGGFSVKHLEINTLNDHLR